MKKTIIIMTLVYSCMALADEIHLNDGTILRGRIIQVTPENIEYDPEGNRSFTIHPRGQIKKIVYDGGDVVMLNEGAGSVTGNQRQPVPTNQATVSRSDARPAEQAPGVESHDGLYFWFLYGGGSSKITVSDNQGEDLEFEGAAGITRVSLGYAFLNNLAGFVTFGLTSIPETDATRGALTIDAQSTEIVMMDLGIGLTYYFMPINIFISASVNSSSAGFSGTYFNEEISTGSAWFLAAGKEWWISDNWGIGVSVFAHIGNGSLEITKTAPKADYPIKYKTYGIAFTATYN